MEVCVRFDDGHMVKLKCDWYVQIHKAKEAILQDRNIVEIILDEKWDDVKAHLPTEDRERLTQFENDFNHAVKDGAKSISAYMFLIRGRDMKRKEFALTEAPAFDAFTRAVAFRIWDDNSYDNALQVMLDAVRNNLGKNAKYEAIRDAWFPGIVYNQY